MSCSDCNHPEHEPGQCKRCNCGEAEVSSLTAPVEVEEMEVKHRGSSSSGHGYNRGHRVKRRKGDEK